MQQLSDDISLKTDNVIFLEFENMRTRALLPDADAVLRYVDSHRKEGKCYVFLDEIPGIRNTVIYPMLWESRLFCVFRDLCFMFFDLGCG